MSARTMTVESTIVKTMFLLDKSADLAEFRERWRRSIAGEIP